MHANALPKVPLTGTASTQTPRRKPRSYANRNNYSDQMPTGRGNQVIKITTTKTTTAINFYLFIVFDLKIIIKIFITTSSKVRIQLVVLQ